MPQPIYLPEKKDPIGGSLQMAQKMMMEMFMQKYQHKMEQDTLAATREDEKQRMTNWVAKNNAENARYKIANDSQKIPKATVSGGSTNLYSQAERVNQPGQPKGKSVVGDWLVMPGKDGSSVIVRNPESLRQEKKSSNGVKTFQSKIEKLMAAYPNLPAQQAVGIVLGTRSITTDPITGESNITDMIDGTQVPLRTDSTGNVVGETPTVPLPIDSTGNVVGKPPTVKSQGKKPVKHPTLWDLADVSTGPVSALKQGASIISGIFGGPISEETAYARQYVHATQQALIRALALNPRYAVAEQKRIEKQIDIAPRIGDNARMLRMRHIAINAYLTKRLETENADSDNRTLPPGMRKAAKQKARAIKHFLDILGVPSTAIKDLSDKFKENIQVISSEEDFLDLEPNTLFIGPDGILRRKPLETGYGNRADGTKKGQGFFGPLNRPDGKVSTEISIGVEFDGKEIQIPTMVPTLTEEELQYLLDGNQPTSGIVQKAIDHAKMRMRAGQSPFLEEKRSGVGVQPLGR